MNRFVRCGVLLGAVWLVGCKSATAQKPFPHSKPISSREHSFRIETLLDRRGVIWGFDFLSRTELIFTERKGRMSRFNLDTRELSEISGVPAVYAEGQGGLLDVRAHKGLIYFCYSEPLDGGATTALARAAVSGKELTEFKKLLSAKAQGDNDIHFGCRIEFDNQGHLFLSVGERGDRFLAQDLSRHNGKILRLNEDGSVPGDNPFRKKRGALPEIWTFGHRNPQGLAIHPNGELWESEFGPRGGDELNWIRPGLNYGWPVITYGREYHGPKIGETHKKGMEQPIVYYVPSISPSGIDFYTGDAFPKWRGNLFLGNLSGQHLRRLVMDGKKVVDQESLLADKHWRIRNVRMGPEGFFYLSTDEGRLLRIVP